MMKKVSLAWMALLVVLAFAGLPRWMRGAPSAAAHLLYTGGLFGQLEPCG